MPPVSVDIYLQRARDFLEAVGFLEGDGAFRHSAALLAIHSAISYSDALRSGLGDRNLLADDHGQAIIVLDALVAAEREVNRDGIRHLRYLLSKKNLVAYGRSRLPEHEVLKLILHAQRFAVWANQSGTKMKVEGWTDVDRRS